MTLLKFWKSILWSAFIFILLLIPGNKIPKNRLFDFEHVDKLVHFMLFAMLEFLILFEGKSTQRKNKIYFFSICYGLLLAGVSEMLQKLPYLLRQANVYDLLADVLGLLLGALIFRWMTKLKFLSFLRN